MSAGERVLGDRYRVGARLGAADGAELYEGEDIRLDRPVTLELLGRDAPARSAPPISHPHLVALYDRGEDPDGAYLVLEPLDGRSLHDVLAQRGNLEPLEAAGLVEQVLAGLGHAHAHGVQHLALGPHEVVLGRDGRWKVLGAGVAPPPPAPFPAPEQTRGEAAGPPADLYAAGAILALALTGAAPETSPPALPGVPLPIANVVTRALDPDLTRRYQSAHEMESDLRAAAAPAPPPPPARVQVVEQAPPPPPPEGKRTSPWAWIAALLVLALAAVALAWWITSDDDEPTATTTTAARVTVPPVVGLAYDDASAQLQSKGLTATRQDVRSNTTQGQVIEADPQGGTSVERGSTVALKVSRGTATVPDVIGATTARATSELESAGFQVQTREASSSDAPNGTVSQQSPSAGADLAVGSNVTITVSTGPAPVNVPNLVGNPEDAAQSTLEDAGLTLGRVTEQTSDETEGTVLSQDPPPNETVDAGTRVDIVVASAPPSG